MLHAAQLSASSRYTTTKLRALSNLGSIDTFDVVNPTRPAVGAVIRMVEQLGKCARAPRTRIVSLPFCAERLYP